MVNNNFWKKKRVLITGHTGFKGGWLSCILKQLNCDLYGISLKPKKLSFYYQAAVNTNFKRSIFSDINDDKKLINFIKVCKPEIIFHLAAQPLVLDSYKQPIKTFQTNIIGTAKLLNATTNLKTLKAFIVVTTDKCYENLDTKLRLFSETDKLGGDDPYSASKACTEIVSAAMYKSFLKKKNINMATVRAGNVIGGGDYSDFRIVPDIFKSIKKKKKLKVRNPNSIRPWQHVLEPLVGYIAIAERLFYNKRYATAWNLGPEKKNIKSVKQLVLDINRLNKFDYKLEKKINKKIESRYLGLNISKIKKAKIWKPKLSFEDTLKLTSDWYLSTNKVEITNLQIKRYLNE